MNRALTELSRAAQAEFIAGFESINPRREYQRNQFIREWFPGLIEKYGIISASVGADVFEMEAVELGLRPQLELAPGVNAEQAVMRLGAELDMTTTLATSLALVDELVKQPYRSTMQQSALASGGGWARVPMGDTCSFCVMLASQGGVYSSKDVAKFGYSGEKYHGECDCEPVLIRSEDDYPAGYNPDALYEEYDRGLTADPASLVNRDDFATEEAYDNRIKSLTGSEPKRVLARMRALRGE